MKGMAYICLHCGQWPMIVLLLLACLSPWTHMGAKGMNTHVVGESKGWTIGSVNYTDWAATKSFLLGDTLVFNYAKQYHNVLQVDKSSYLTCTINAVFNSYDDGKTTVVLSNPGSYFYMCGIPGHCQVGQRLKVHVPKKVHASSPQTPKIPKVVPSPDDSPPTSFKDASLAPFLHPHLKLHLILLSTLYVMFCINT